MPEIEIAVEQIGETPDAYRFFDGRIDFWIPKSAITDSCEENGAISSIFISEWWAAEKGLI